MPAQAAAASPPPMALAIPAIMVPRFELSEPMICHVFVNIALPSPPKPEVITSTRTGITKAIPEADPEQRCAEHSSGIHPEHTVKWYEYFDDFASLLNHPKSLVRNRVLYILAANEQWDDENRFDAILNDFLAHVID